MEGPAPSPTPSPTPSPSAGPYAVKDTPAAAGATERDQAQVVDAVMAGLQTRIDLMVEYRLREALAPLLARAADAIVHDARDELAHTLRDVVARAVSQEMALRRSTR